MSNGKCICGGTGYVTVGRSNHTRTAPCLTCGAEKQEMTLAERVKWIKQRWGAAMDRMVDDPADMSIAKAMTEIGCRDTCCPFCGLPIGRCLNLKKSRDDESRMIDVFCPRCEAFIVVSQDVKTGIVWFAGMRR